MCRQGIVLLNLNTNENVKELSVGQAIETLQNNWQSGELPQLPG